MMLQDHPPLHLAYCLNVHAGESFRDQWNAVSSHVAAVRDQRALPPGKLFGLGLRLGRAAAEEARRNGLAQMFGDWCRDNGFYVFTINGFPYGDFHGVPVKTQVYRPDWTRPERRDYTMALADHLAAWLPEGVPGSISTVPGWYAPDYPDSASAGQAARMSFQHLVEVARHMETVSEATGRDLCLGLEPEPWCRLETASDAVRFFEALFSAHAGEEDLLRRRVGVCVDTCHCAMAFEQPAEVMRALAGAGIRIAKIQLSAALSVINTAGWRSSLEPFIEPVYCHQVCARGEGKLRRWPDLPAAIRALDSGEAWEEARTHFHVPLHWEGRGPLQTTRDNMDAAFWGLAQTGICPHLEIETYTFHVLPGGMAAGGLMESMAREYQWVGNCFARFRE